MINKTVPKSEYDEVVALLRTAHSMLANLACGCEERSCVDKYGQERISLLAQIEAKVPQPSCDCGCYSCDREAEWMINGASYCGKCVPGGRGLQII